MIRVKELTTTTRTLQCYASKQQYQQRRKHNNIVSLHIVKVLPKNVTSLSLTLFKRGLKSKNTDQSLLLFPIDWF
jgi:hypothetical protein